MIKLVMSFITVGIFLAALPRPVLADSLFGTNLIVNGDAEANLGSPTGAIIGPIVGFVTAGSFTVPTYGATLGFPLAASPGPSARGQNFFAGGPNVANSTGTQILDVSSASDSIDAESVNFVLHAFLGGFATQGDYGALSIRFIDATNATLDIASIGPVRRVDRSDETALLFRATSGIIPVGTRSIEVFLQFSRFDGSYNDGYADNLTLLLNPVPEPRPSLLLSAGFLFLLERSRRHFGPEAAPSNPSPLITA